MSQQPVADPALKGKKNVSGESPDHLAIEEPLEIRLDFWSAGKLKRKSVSVTMRTPGHDFELAVGFLFTEGIITNFTDIERIGHCGPPVKGQDFHNIARIALKPGVSVDTSTMERNFYTTSSCGICGKTSIDALSVNNAYGKKLKRSLSLRMNEETLLALPERMRAEQGLFQRTGGCHASGLFDSQGALVCVREDVGRHNALDKLIGWALMNGYLPLFHYGVLVSGRASFELMQKASMAGIPLLSAIGAPSTLAVEVAKKFGMTLIGFLNRQRFNVYHDLGRIQNRKVSHGRGPRQNGKSV